MQTFGVPQDLWQMCQASRTLRGHLFQPPASSLRKRLKNDPEDLRPGSNLACMCHTLFCTLIHTHIHSCTCVYTPALTVCTWVCTHTRLHASAYICSHKPETDFLGHTCILTHRFAQPACARGRVYHTDTRSVCPVVLPRVGQQGFSCGLLEYGL